MLRTTRAPSGDQFWVAAYEPPGRVARVATIGLSRCRAADDLLFGVELVFTLGKIELVDIGDYSLADVRRPCLLDPLS